MHFALLLALFFCSGACGLIYQVLWLRQLSVVFGVTVYAASTVLAAFMAGLALGSASAGRLLTRVKRPLLLFGMAEILIGISALATPLGFDLASLLYQRLQRLNPDSIAMVTFARLINSFALLLVPTLLMGLTLPVLSASSLVRGRAWGTRVSALYAINTAGAVTGAVLTGFYLIGAIGISRSFQLAAAINLGVGLAAIALSRRVEREPVADPAAAVAASASGAPPPSNIGALTIVAAISGFVALALEIVWFRMLLQYLAATAYAFSTMLATVLAGIAIGSAIAARLLRRGRDWLTWLAILQVVTSVLCLASAIFLGLSYRAGWRTSGDWQASAAAILPVTIVMGLCFPILLHVATSGAAATAMGPIARRVGRLYSFNTLGAIAGALLCGFVVLPGLGVRLALIVLAAVGVVSAAILLAVHPAPRRPAVAVGALIAIFAALVPRVPDPFAAAYERRYGRDMREFWRDEGAQTAVSVHASEFRRSLYLDGLHQANDGPEMVRLHRTIGHLPMVLHGEARDALVIGLGGGATSGAVSQYPDARVQIVELSESVRKAASFFAHVNYDVLNQPNVRVRVDDGRNFLLLSGETFDVITADIIQPTHAGAGHLYSREYFLLVRRALKPGGVALQWIGHRPPEQYRLIMRTFLSVFPHVTLWLDGNLMVGSDAPVRVSREKFAHVRSNAQTAAALDEIGLRTFEDLQSWYTAGADEMRRFVGAGLTLTDDHPLLEYHRSLVDRDEPLDLTPLRGDVRNIIN